MSTKPKRCGQMPAVPITMCGLVIDSDEEDEEPVVIAEDGQTVTCDACIDAILDCRRMRTRRSRVRS